MTSASSKEINDASLTPHGRGETLTITLLVDNTAPESMAAEHGFSAWIEAGEKCILFDTGQGPALVPNARHLGIDLGLASTLVLSHGHYDHTGGIPEFLSINHRARVFHSRGASDRRLSCHPGVPPKSIGMPAPSLRALDSLPNGKRFELTSAHVLAPGIGITGPIPRCTAFEDAGGPFFFDETKKHPDPVADDLSLWFETGEGLVILCGCCHAGLVNTVLHARQLSGINRIHGIIGGLHLLHAGEERLRATRAFLAECQPDFLAPCHCTGAHVIDWLRKGLGEKIVTPIQAGQRMEVGSLKSRSNER